MINGELKHTMTPQKMEVLFIEHPVVQRAYEENVPHNVSM
jgi:hypothetical protein